MKTLNALFALSLLVSSSHNALATDQIIDQKTNSEIKWQCSCTVVINRELRATSQFSIQFKEGSENTIDLYYCGSRNYNVTLTAGLNHPVLRVKEASNNDEIVAEGVTGRVYYPSGTGYHQNQIYVSAANELQKISVSFHCNR